MFFDLARYVLQAVPEAVGQSRGLRRENPVFKRVAITVESKNGLQSSLDPRFGRARAFLIVDPDSREIIAELDNDSENIAHGGVLELRH